MKHVGWLKDRTPHTALHGESPYKMKHGKAPHLGDIHAFGTAVYMKDLNARKLNTCAQLGCFVGYDSESKSFHIYWATKCNVSVERNIGKYNPLCDKGGEVGIKWVVVAGQKS